MKCRWSVIGRVPVDLRDQLTERSKPQSDEDFIKRMTLPSEETEIGLSQAFFDRAIEKVNEAVDEMIKRLEEQA